jgi:hypothetical protein
VGPMGVNFPTPCPVSAGPKETSRAGPASDLLPAGHADTCSTAVTGVFSATSERTRNGYPRNSADYHVTRRRGTGSVTRQWTCSETVLGNLLPLDDKSATAEVSHAQCRVAVVSLLSKTTRGQRRSVDRRTRTPGPLLLSAACGNPTSRIISTTLRRIPRNWCPEPEAR